MRRLAFAILLLVPLAVWVVTEPSTIPAEDLPDYTGDAAAGERVFWAGGCASCHATPVKG